MHRFTDSVGKQIRRKTERRFHVHVKMPSLQTTAKADRRSFIGVKSFLIVFRWKIQIRFVSVGGIFEHTTSLSYSRELTVVYKDIPPPPGGSFSNQRLLKAILKTGAYEHSTGRGREDLERILNLL